VQRQYPTSDMQPETGKLACARYGQMAMESSMLILILHACILHLHLHMTHLHCALHPGLALIWTFYTHNCS
jgi:hypothetical protein